MKWILLVFMWIWADLASSQTTLIHRKMKTLLQRNETSGNLFGERDLFFHRSTAVGGFVIQPKSGDFNMKYSDSYFVHSGGRVVFNRSRRVSPVLSYGANFCQMAIVQNDKQPLGFGIQHQKQQIRQWSFPVGFALRYNWYTRGYGPGLFTELGGFGYWNFVNQLFEQDKTSEGADFASSKQRTYYDRPSFLQKMGYGLEGRIGMGHVSVCLKYRSSKLFKQVSSINGGVALPELSPWQVGIEFNSWNRRKVNNDEDED